MAGFSVASCLLISILAACVTSHTLNLGRFKLKLPSWRLNLMSENREVCYGLLGCFSVEGDFSSRPLNVLPADPSSINTRFYLYTRTNATGDGVRIQTGHLSGLLDSGFDASRPSKLLIHGLLDNGRSHWLNRMRGMLLVQGDYNVVQVDWGEGSHLPYTQAIANTRVAGAEIARLLDFIKSNTDAQLEDVHLIGHSLGAHVAGYAGERLDDLGRITALDPAGPNFEGMPASVKVDRTDALLVDVIHTDASNFMMETLMQDSGLGMEEETGHLDFYPNNGREQPGCEPIRSITSTSFVRNIFQDTMSALYGGGRSLLACSHLKSIDLMIESITTSCPFRAYPCMDYAMFLAGRCLECTEDMPCAELGLHSRLPSNESSSRRHHLYSQAGAQTPSCRHHYGLSVTLGGANTTETDTYRGWLNVIYMGETANITERISASPDSRSSFELMRDETYTLLSTTTLNVGVISGVQLWWKCDSPWWDLMTCWCSSTLIHINSVEVFHGESQNRYTFATGEDLAITPGEVITIQSTL